MKIKVGDEVLVIAGKDKGKSGKVIKTFKEEQKVLVEQINMVKKHMKPNNANETGGIVERENPIHVSNVKKIVKEAKEKAVKKTVKAKKAS